MGPTIIHVEDDPYLGALVRAAFQRFGFGGFVIREGTLLAFFRGQLGVRDLSPDQLAGIRDMQERRVARVEQVRASLARKPTPTVREALGFAATIAVDFAETNLLAILDLLYSKAPVVAEALCELMSAHWSSLADRFEQEEDCPELVRVAVELRHRLDVIAAHASFPSR